jgi:glycosyltransferase involved in cell wall biosynthesis
MKSNHSISIGARRKRRLVLIAHNAYTIINFRGPLIRELVSRGIDVYAFAPDYEEITKEGVIALGASPIQSSLSRATANPLRDICDLVRMWRLLIGLRADMALSYTIKPVIYGTLAARMAGVPDRYAMIEGAGHLFTDDGKISLRRGLLRLITAVLYRIGLSQAKRVFLLNRDDIKLFTSSRMLSEEKAVLIDGIGLDLMHYHVVPPVVDPICFIFVARLLKEKGIYDFIAAAEIVKAAFPDVRFMILGGVDINPTSVTSREVEAWKMSGLVEFLGQVSDVRPWLAQSSVFVLPSYREGLPRSTQEAMATGRPVITTDVPGCRDTVIDGENGFLIPVRDPSALAKAMLRFVSNPQLVVSMGEKSRIVAEARFDVDLINAKVLEIMGL